MKRKHPSGAQKRNIHKARIEETKLMAGTLLKFVQHKSEKQKEDEERVSNTVSQITSSALEAGPSISAAERQLVIVNNTRASETGLVEEKDENINNFSREKLSSSNASESDSDNNYGSSKQINTVLLFSDVGYWPVPMPNNLRSEIIKQGSEAFQNKDGPFKLVYRGGEKTKGETRTLTKNWFFKQAPGEKVLRTWMVYSPYKESLYCFCCKLFTTDENKPGTSSSFVTGFQKWWKLDPKVYQHEGSDSHKTNFEKWKILGPQLTQNKTIDAANRELRKTEKKKWNDVLHRLLDVTLFLAKQNLAFRGHRENINSENRGNFLELVELLSHYDPVLKEHLLHIKDTSKSVNAVTYLSPSTQNEFINLLGNSVKDKILSDIKKAKYFGIMFDSTPDVAHIDQMSEVIRYVHVENGKVEVRESFLGFFTLTGKKACNITEDIVNALKHDGLDLQLCRSQAYDNEPTMAGIYSGVQARIHELNSKILFVPCANHSLNLCGVHAFAMNPSSVTFFGTLESVYNFFSSSPHRWDVLKQVMGVAVKKLSDTRWSAQHDAVKPIVKNFDKLVQATERLCDLAENVDTRGSAEVLLTNICDFKFLGYLHLWFHVLEEINHAQKYLQTKGLSLENTVIQLKSLKNFLLERQNDLVDEAIKFSATNCEEMGISLGKRGRIRRKKVMPGEQSRDAGLSLEEETKRCMLECIDKLHQELEVRMKSMERVFEIFGIIQPYHLLNDNDEQLSILISNFCKAYEEFDKDETMTEIKRLRNFIKAAGVPKEELEKWISLKVLQFIVEMDLTESVPNVYVALKLFLTVCVSVASNERSFSKLKLIKTYLRSTMSQARLNGLAILSVEREAANKADFDEIIKEFAEAKVRKQKVF